MVKNVSQDAFGDIGKQMREEEEKRLAAQEAKMQDSKKDDVSIRFIMPADIHKRIKIIGATMGKSFQEILEEGLNLWLGEQVNEPAIKWPEKKGRRG